MKHSSVQGQEELKCFADDNFAQPRAVKMMNLLAKQAGKSVRFSDNSIKPNAPGSAVLN